jgi:uncharacterized damage-inducible protein DinB
MTTREDLIAGLEMMLAQARRTTAYFTSEEWEERRAAGWTPKQIYAHLATVARLIPQMAPMLLSAAEDADPAANMDLTAMNEQAVASMAAMTPQDVMAAFEANTAAVIDYLRSLTDEQLAARRTLLGYRAPIADLLANLVLHGMHHVYEAQARVAA